MGSRGRGWGFAQLVKRIETQTQPPCPEWEPPKRHPSIDLHTVKKINHILAERNAPKKKKKVVVPNIIINPQDLEPIHLRSDPLLPLSPTTELFCHTNGAGNIIKQRRRDQAKYIPTFRSQPPRAKNSLIDDSAVESDGEGGDIPSRATTPPNSRPTSPVLPITPTPPIDLSIQVPIVKRKIKKPKEHCKTCNRFFDGIKQLDFHKKSKKHLKQVRNSATTTCKQCNRFFTSRHNFSTHKCENFL